MAGLVDPELKWNELGEGIGGKYLVDFVQPSPGFAGLRGQIMRIRTAMEIRQQPPKGK
jgi:hypothetical protein